MKKGYSLVELTISVGLISLLTISISAIVLSSIISSHRLRALVRIRQVGDYTIGQLERLVRNARSIESCSSTAHTLSLTNQDGNLTNILFDGGTSRIASSSASQSFYLTPTDLSVSAFSLTCQPSDLFPELVNVSFTLENALNANTRTIENPSIDFSTSIELRNN
ncbi:MAG: hypothetical protein ABII80_03910 [bacterium]